ncbi:hypothetical protein ECDEC14D_1961 [Escherichia coli DEC14D]|nr:hypothetical protein ECDEC14C_1959 [Escherichia coli DEC14C]EHX92729.1 hypothetical protein ECDEC14D_1961 [Escherichia coli DEC14D]
MEGKNGLKIVCDSGAGFFYGASCFPCQQSCKKNAIAKTKVQFAAI